MIRLAGFISICLKDQRKMSNPPCLIRMDSASFTCCYGNDVYSFQVRRAESALVFFPGDLQDSEEVMWV